MERRLHLGLAAAVAAAATAAGTMVAAATAAQQTSTVERTVSCATAQGALQISAFAKNPAAGAAAAVITTGTPSTPTTLLGVDTRYKHYVLGKSCSRTATRIPLTHRGLTPAAVSRADQYNSPLVYCSATQYVRIHFKLRFDSSGKPMSATIAVRTKPKPGKPSKAIGYVQWTPQQSATYYAKSLCTSK